MKIAICTGIWRVTGNGYYATIWKKVELGAIYPVEETDRLGFSEAIMLDGESICSINSTIGQRFFKIIECENTTKGV